MNDENPISGTVCYLTTEAAARLTGMTPSWFERSRWAGGGPPFVKVGRAVRYPTDELHNWMRSRLRTSTTGVPAPGPAA